ncbi:MAG: hypothetical protein A7315_09760 [Candidatus Altiarchaeales archaeon WOR_SM1_79]|nr:MAG: hypothetical protein A7315_09760 [Candidatus Altiarchaeales archaeon WOR_SM1_79]
MPVWGRKKKETQEALSSAKSLIMKVKKKGLDTAEAESLYKEGKRFLKSGKYIFAMEKIEEAKKSAKRTYAKGIKDRLKFRISQLDERIREMEGKNLKTEKTGKYLKEAKDSLKGGVREYKKGLRSAKEGLKLAEHRLETYNKVSGFLDSTGTFLRRMEDLSPNLKILEIHKKELEKLNNLKSKGKVKTALMEAEKLHTDVKKISEKYSRAQKSIEALKKSVRDAEILEANIDKLSNLDEINSIFMDGKFESAYNIAEKSRKEIEAILKDHKEAKFHVDTAIGKVLEVKSWGFSAYEAEKSLNLAKEALKNRDFEKATAIAEESKEKASTIRERHKRSLELIQKAKKDLMRMKAQGKDISEMQEIIREAESEFDRGDYTASEKKIEMIIGVMKNRE